METRLVPGSLKPLDFSLLPSSVHHFNCIFLNSLFYHLIRTNTQVNREQEQIRIVIPLCGFETSQYTGRLGLCFLSVGADILKLMCVWRGGIKATRNALTTGLASTVPNSAPGHVVRVCQES